MNNKYILLRHGETEYQAKNLDIIYPEKENPGISLTENGKEKIKAAAKELKREKISLIFSSDFLRTKQTAEIVAEELGLNITFDKRLRDTDFGVFQGKSGEEYGGFFSEEKEKFSKRPAEGENWKDVRKRAIAVVKDIEKKYKGEKVLIVSHADPVWLLAGCILGLSEGELLKRRREGDLWPNVGQYIII